MNIGFGIDGGGTRSRLLLFDVNSLEVLSRSEGGPTNPHSAGMDSAWQHVEQLLQSGCREMGLSISDLACGCLGSAGLGREQEQAAFRSFFARLMPAPVHVCTDGEILLVGSTGSMEGYCLIAGTGSFALGRNQQGQVVRSGGLGHMLGDEGSASWMGWQAVRRALRSLEGRDLATGMLPALLSHFDAGNKEALIPLFHQHFDKAQTAAAAPLVLKAAAAGDLLALDILEQAAQELYRLVNSVIRQQPHDQITLSLAGGLLERDTPLQAALLKQIKAAHPDARVSIARHQDAAKGACMLAAALVKG